MISIDQIRMEQVVQKAFDKVTGSRRWQTAIARAKRELEETRTYTLTVARF